MKMESHIHFKLFDAVTKYFDETLRQRRMIA